MRTLPRSALVAVAATVSMAFTAVQVSAQQPAAQQPAQPEACSATVQPSTVPAGNAATQLSVTLSKSIGDVSDFQAAEDSGLKLAATEDLPKVPMTQEGKQEHKPIEMANEGNSVTLWINTQGAKEGTYDFTLVGAQGQCTGKVTIGSGGS
jgi:hypothetical protein